MKKRSIPAKSDLYEITCFVHLLPDQPMPPLFQGRSSKPQKCSKVIKFIISYYKHPSVHLYLRLDLMFSNMFLCIFISF